MDPPGVHLANRFYGARLAHITDPHGNQWSISAHIEYLAPDQIAERLAGLDESQETA